MHTVIKRLTTLAFIATVSSLAAQSAPPPANQPNTATTATAETADEVVQLSPFLVSGGASVGRYTSLESTSAGRVRVNIMDSSQNVSVITSEMLTDVAAG